MLIHHPKKTISLDDKAFTMSLSDLLAGLLAIFILVLCFTTLYYQKARARYTDNNIMREELIKDIQREMAEKGIDVNVEPDKGMIHVPANLLFATGEADLGPQGQAAVYELASSILGHVKDKEHYANIGTIYIEGHTDNVPIENYKFASNWELSTQRAINTYNMMRRMYPTDMDQAKNLLGEPMFSCSGYADTRPIGDNNTDGGRQKNRRIDIRIVMLPSAEEEGR